MKKLLIVPVLMLLIDFTGWAQGLPPHIYNETACNFSIVWECWEPEPCINTALFGVVESIPNKSSPGPQWSSSAIPGYYCMFKICWDDAGCTTCTGWMSESQDVRSCPNYSPPVVYPASTPVYLPSCPDNNCCSNGVSTPRVMDSGLGYLMIRCTP